MFNATQFVIDKVRRITQINLATGLVDFTGTSVESPQIEFTGESTDKTDATLKHVPTSAPAAVYTMSEDKNISGMIEVGVDEGNAKIEGKVITLPASFVGTTVGVFYEYETDSAVKLVDSAESFAEAAMYVVDILAADVCNPSVKRAGKIVFPKAKIDNNFTVNLTTEGTHPFSFTALKDYCADDAELCYILFEE